MLSRVAENLYWISRYVERAENVARLVDDAYHQELDAGLARGGAGSRALAEVARLVGCSDLPSERDAALDCLAFDPTGPHSIRGMIARARENARGSQEALSAEAWGQLNQLHLFLSAPRAKTRMQASPFRFFERVRRECLLFAAVVDDTLPRAAACHFLQLGRSLERVDMTSRILYGRFAHGAAGPDAAGEWEGLLRICSAKVVYLQRYQERIDPEGVVGFLLLAADFPRAVRFNVARALESLRAIVVDAGDLAPGRTPAERLLGRLESDLHYADPAELFARGVGPFLAAVQEASAHAGAEIHQAYFLS